MIDGSKSSPSTDDENSRILNRRYLLSTPHAPPPIPLVDATPGRRVQPLAALPAVAGGGATTSGALRVDPHSGCREHLSPVVA